MVENFRSLEEKKTCLGNAALCPFFSLFMSRLSIFISVWRAICSIYYGLIIKNACNKVAGIWSFHLIRLLTFKTCFSFSFFFEVVKLQIDTIRKLMNASHPAQHKQTYTSHMYVYMQTWFVKWYFGQWLVGFSIARTRHKSTNSIAI